MQSRSRAAIRAAALIISLLTVAVVAAPAATADTTSPGAYRAKATATALELTVFGQSLSLGLSHAENASDPTAVAKGLGALVPTLGNQVEKTATANPNQTNDTQAETCGPISLPNDFPVLDLATACSSATAALTTDGFPLSTGKASVATLSVNANDVLGNSLSQVNQPIGQLLDGLKPVFDAVSQSGIDAQSLLNKIISAITDGGTLVRVTLGPSQSDSGAGAQTETGAATAEGAVVEILPRDALELQPVVTILVGAASNTISIDRATGKATTAYEPSLVKVTLADDIAKALNLTDAQKSFSVAPGVSQCLGLPAPLDSCIDVASGTSGVTPEGVTHAEASGVKLHLLTGVQDGVLLNLASTSVEGIGVVDTTVSDTPSLARTGGSVNMFMGGAAFAVAAGGMMLARASRRRGDLV